MGRLLSSDGSSLEWEIAKAAKTGFSAHLKVTPPGRTSAEAESYKGDFASRDDAIAWLRSQARARGFDARGIK
jgi:hypothetical protein